MKNGAHEGERFVRAFGRSLRSGATLWFLAILACVFGALTSQSALAWDGVFVPTNAKLGFAQPTPVLALLPDHRVLMLSGYDISLYDPATRSSTSVGQTADWWIGGSAFVLPGGKVLILGGADLHPTESLFDPVSLTMAPGPALLTARFYATYTRLADGRIFAAGGCSDGSCTAQLGSTELYTPATGRFTPGPALTHSRSHQTATLLDDGRVLLVAGIGAFGCPVDDCILGDADIFDPATNTVKYLGSLDQSGAGEQRYAHAAALAGNGGGLVCGGWFHWYATDQALGICQLFDPDTNAFYTSPTISPRWFHSAVALNDGSVLLAGGSGIYNTAVDTADVYEPTTYGLGAVHALTRPGTTSRDVMTTIRSNASALLLADGSVLFAGGQLDVSQPASLDSIELYLPDRVFAAGFEP